MAQHDGVIDNGPGLSVRTDLNAALQAILSQNSGPVEPGTMYPGMLWLDTTVTPDGLLRQRNQANTAWISPTVGNMTVTVLTSSGTWTKPAGLRFLEVWCIGGGGGGTNGAATAAGQTSGSGGGGGGGSVFKLYRAADLSATEAYTVGAAGTTPAGAGAAGGNSAFKGLTAGGGGGGGAIAAATASLGIQSQRGAAGTASGGDLNVPGEAGSHGWCNPHGRVGVAAGGIGGGSVYALPATYQFTSGASAGVAGNFPGGGASGGACGPSQAGVAGAIGSVGCIIIKEIF